MLLLGEPVLERRAAFEMGVYKAWTVESTIHVAVALLLSRAGDRLLLDIGD